MTVRAQKNNQSNQHRSCNEAPYVMVARSQSDVGATLALRDKVCSALTAAVTMPRSHRLLTVYTLSEIMLFISDGDPWNVC